MKQLNKKTQDTRHWYLKKKKSEKSHECKMRGGFSVNFWLCKFIKSEKHHFVRRVEIFADDIIENNMIHILSFNFKVNK